MLRSLLLFLSRQSWLRHWMETSSIADRITRRFIAGQNLEQALGVCRRLNGENILVTLDYLGENVRSLEEAGISRDTYLKDLDEISARGLNSSVSVKLTQLGLDFSVDACRANVGCLVERAKAAGTRVEIDMESSDYVDRTLSLVSGMHEQYGSVRAVIQAYLYRSEKDVDQLNLRGIPIRLCKGAYSEPPEVAFSKKPEVDANYVRLMERLLDRGTYPAIATHDEKIIQRALAFVRERKLEPERFEFQMLYGIRRDLQRKLVKAGYRLRLYVPYGNAWYPYFMRRLAERPANVVFLVRNMLRR